MQLQHYKNAPQIISRQKACEPLFSMFHCKRKCKRRSPRLNISHESTERFAPELPLVPQDRDYVCPYLDAVTCRGVRNARIDSLRPKYYLYLEKVLRLRTGLMTYNSIKYRYQFYRPLKRLLSLRNSQLTYAD
jgi:hypothetical protein